MQGKFS